MEGSWRSLGALLTVLIVAIDPFFQQITHYESGPRVIGNSSAIPARRLFDSGIDNEEAHSQIKDGMRAAIYQGLFFTGASNDTSTINALSPRPTCNSGNCTYPEFETLAVCTKCANVTDKIQRSWTTIFGSNAYNWSLPNGFYTGNIEIGDGGHPILMTSASHDAIRLRAGLPMLTLTAISIPSFFDVVDYGPSPNASIAVIAQECMLHWCVKKFQSKITNAILPEKLLQTTSNGDDDIGLLYHFKPPGSNATLNIDPYLLYRSFGPYPTGHLNGTFLVNKNASALITQFFQSIIEGQATFNGFEDYSGIGSTPTVQRLSTASGGIPAVFDLLALTVTTAIREATNIMTRNEDNLTIAGTESIAVTYIRVRWWWLALPVCLRLGTAVFLLITITNSARAKLAMWKSSALALMFHGMSGEGLVHREKIGNVVEMGAVAGRVNVVLGDGEEVSGRRRLEVWRRKDGIAV